METAHHHGILMRGLGRWFVYSRPRAWLGRAVEVPSLLRGICIPRGATCLDLAAGVGWASVGLARRDPSARIVAVDYDDAILPRTRDCLASHAAVHAAVCRADGKHLPFRAGSFDLVLCLYGLHHFRRYLEALREIARVLKPGGTFALIDPIRKKGKPPSGHHGIDVLAVEDLVRMLGEAGFDSVAPRISLGRAKAVIHKTQELQRPDRISIASKLNATKHGLRATEVTIPGQEDTSGANPYLKKSPFCSRPKTEIRFREGLTASD